MATEAAAHANTERRFRDPLSSRSVVLWAGVLVPPFAWAANLVLGDLLFELGCARAVRGGHILGLPLKAWGLIESAVLAGAAIAGGLLALRAWREIRRRTNGTRWDRAHAMALAGMASGFIYLLLIAFGFLPLVLFRTCDTSL